MALGLTAQQIMRTAMLRSQSHTIEFRDMGPVTITDVHNTQAFLSIWSILKRAVADAGAEAMREEAVKFFEENTHGGGRWLPLAESTVFHKIRRNLPNPNQILFEEGGFINYMKTPEKSIRRDSPDFPQSPTTFKNVVAAGQATGFRVPGTAGTRQFFHPIRTSPQVTRRLVGFFDDPLPDFSASTNRSRGNLGGTNRGMVRTFADLAFTHEFGAGVPGKPSWTPPRPWLGPVADEKGPNILRDMARAINRTLGAFGNISRQEALRIARQQNALRSRRARGVGGLRAGQRLTKQARINFAKQLSQGRMPSALNDAVVQQMRSAGLFKGRKIAGFTAGTPGSRTFSTTRVERGFGVGGRKVV